MKCKLEFNNELDGSFTFSYCGQFPLSQLNSPCSLLLMISNWDLIIDMYPYALQAIRTGWVHPNINLENPDDRVVRCFALEFEIHAKR